MTRAALTLSTGRTTFHPPYCAQERDGDFLLVDGISRGTRWNRLTSTADEIGITGPVGAPTMATSGSGSNSYVCGYRYVDRNRVQPSSLSAVRTITGSATSGITYTWTTLLANTASRVQFIEAYRSTAGQTTTLYPIYLTGYTVTPHATVGTTITNSNGYVKLTTAAAAAHGYEVGDYVDLAGFTPAEYNTTHKITSIPSADTFVTHVGYTQAVSVVGTCTQRVYQFGDAGTWNSEGDNGSGSCRFVYTGPQRLAVGMRILVANSSVAGYNTTHQITAVTRTTFDTNVAHSSNEADGGTWTMNGLAEAVSDANLAPTTVLFPALPILNPDGSVNARRFEPPPTFKSAICMFQDRAWYAVDAIYNDGTITLSNSSQTVTGASTAFTSDMVGRYLHCTTETAPLLITGYSSATSITIEKNPTGNTSGLSYAIAPAESGRSAILFSEVDEAESVPPTNEIIIQENTGDSDVITGMMAHGSNLYVFKDRHTYKLSFARQPLIDANVTLAWSRGCINRRTWTTWADIAFVMDAAGIYAVPLFGGGGVENISEPIQNIFRDGTIDWSKSKWFYAVTDYENWSVRFYVCYTTDASTRPKRCLVFNIATQSWDPESYVEELGGACVVEISGKPRVLVGGEDDYIRLINEGTVDGKVAVTRSLAVESATSSTVVISDTDSDSDQMHANHLYGSIAIVSGTGKHQVRRITAVNTTTDTYTVAPNWTTTPDTTSKVIVGGIPWNLKTQEFEYPDAKIDAKAAQGTIRGLQINLLPTTYDSRFDVRHYPSHATTPATHYHQVNQGNGVEIAANSTDAVVLMKLARSTLAGSKGVFPIPIAGGRSDGASQSDRIMAHELRGVGGLTDDIRIYDLTVYGALDGDK